MSSPRNAGIYLTENSPIAGCSRGHVLPVTSLGPLDVLCQLGDEGYEELIGQTVEMDLGAGCRCRVLSLAKLIELKEASGREKDKLALPTLRATLREKQRSGS